METLPAASPQRLATGALMIAVLNTIAVTVLFGTETGFLAGSLDWSLVGLLHLPPVVYLPIGAVPVALALVATAAVAKRAWIYERQAGR